MMKILKWIIIAINAGIIYIAYKWYSPQNQFEPVIVILGQLISLITLTVEQSKVDIHNEDVDNLEMDVDTEGHTNLTNKGVKNSKFNIKKR